MKKLNLGNKLEVVSLGCGNFVDGYALSQVLPDDCVLDYYGVDCVYWHNRLHLRTGDSLHFMKMDAIDYLRQQQMLTGDIYVFPKSISEFSLEDMREICTVFGQKKIPKNEISFIFSLRNSNNEEEAKNDLRKTKMLYDVMLESGFITEDDVSNIIRPEQPQRQISEVDKDSSRPLIAIDFINNLPARCNDVKSCACKGCPAYTARQPITTCNYIAGQIFTFRKRGYLQ